MGIPPYIANLFLGGDGSNAAFFDGNLIVDVAAWGVLIIGVAMAFKAIDLAKRAIRKA